MQDIPSLQVSSELPNGFSRYQTAIGGSLTPNEAEVINEHQQQPPQNQEQNKFNKSFADIQEIRKDGKLITVIKSGSTFNNENEKRARFGEYSLLLRRITDPSRNKDPITQLEIQSKCLRDSFAAIASGITTIALNNDPIVIPWPYHEIYYCREKIKRAHEDAEDDETKAEVQLLIDFQERFMQQSINTSQQYIDHKYIDFQWLWCIFPPGETVVIQNSAAANTPIQWCATIKSYKLEVRDTGITGWCITVIYTAFNGWRFGNSERSLRFPAFAETVPINQLPAYPLRFAEGQNDINDKALERGRAYEAYCLKSSKMSQKPNGTPRWHEGPIWLEREPGREDRLGCRITDAPVKNVKGRVIVDFEGFYSRSPVFRDTLVLHGSEDDEDDPRSYEHEYRKWKKGVAVKRALTDGSISRLGPPDIEPSLTPEQLRTFFPLVPAYSFSTHDWGLVFIDDLKSIQWDAKAFESLQVDRMHKEAVKGLIQGFSTHATYFDDFIEGKGAGLVFLLHGPPGSGKTMTAESISEELQKPLYHVSGGELGSTVETIQYSLETAFQVAARWDAILLLDEADAFLAKREGGDIERNSLVAVFLRLLEYQSGIIFLTTNRLSDFDPAFRSRIHLQMLFKPLDHLKRQAIWTRLSERSNRCSLTPEQATALGRLPLNGRRIKNILRLASLFAADRQRDYTSGMNVPFAEETSEARHIKTTFKDIQKVLPLATACDWVADGSKGQDCKQEEELAKALQDILAK